MTQSKRILINVLASHARSVVVLLCSFLTSRWALEVLGVENYGLLGLIAGLVVFATVVNQTLSTAICRFFACSIGESEKTDGGVELCRRWFSLAVLLHLILAGLLVAIAYPVLSWLISNYIDIPVDRVRDCLVVNRWVCLSAFVAMISVPFKAMFVAKQNIVELTAYSVAQTLAYTGALFYMSLHPGNWFVSVAVWLFIQGSAANILTIIRSFCLFSECRVCLSYVFDGARLKQLVAFSGWEFIGSYGFALRNQGMSVLVNQCYGPSMNASFSVAISLAGRTQTFANEVNAAFSPAIATVYGSGNVEQLRCLSMACSKYSSCLVALFSVPMMLVMDDFLVFWLKTPPVGTTGICVFICLSHMIDKLTSGQHFAIIAGGKNRSLQLAVGLWYAMTLPIAYAGYRAGFGISSAGLAFALASVGICVCRVGIAKTQVKLEVLPWFRQLVLPMAGIVIACSCVSLAVRQSLSPGFVRLATVGAIFVLLYALLAWHFLLQFREREVVTKSFVSKFWRLLGRMS